MTFPFSKDVARALWFVDDRGQLRWKTQVGQRIHQGMRAGTTAHGKQVVKYKGRRFDVEELKRYIA